MPEETGETADEQAEEAPAEEPLEPDREEEEEVENELTPPPGEEPEAAPGPQGLSTEDLDAVLRAAGVDAKLAVAGEDLAVTDIPPVAAPGAGSIEMLNDVALDVRIELGRTEMLLEDVLRLGAGSVLALDKLAGDPVDVLVNGQLVAHGEVMVLDDNFCVRITEIISPAEAPG